MKKISIFFAGCLIFTIMAATVQASPMNWHSGEQRLSSPNALYHAQFMLTETRDVVIYTDTGKHFNAGLFLWDKNKNFIDANEDGYKYTVNHNGHSQSIRLFDGYIKITLPAGNYYMTLVPLLDGENADSMSFATLDELLAKRAGKPLEELGQYYDGSGLFSFHALGVDSAGPYTPQPAVPLPASALLLAPGLVGLTMLRRKFI